MEYPLRIQKAELPHHHLHCETRAETIIKIDKFIEVFLDEEDYDETIFITDDINDGWGAISESYVSSAISN